MLFGAVFVELGVHIVPRTQALNKGKLITYQRYTQRLRPVYTYPDSFISADISLWLQNSTRLHGVWLNGELKIGELNGGVMISY